MKSGSAASNTTSYFTQMYNVSFQNYFLDPRFLVYNLGVGYQTTNYHNSQIDTTDGLNYNASLSFLPAMNVSWDLTGSRNTQNVQEATSPSDYDVTSTTYGGSVYLKLKSWYSKSNGNGNRNNNNNNNNDNNNAGSWSILPWLVPNIGLHYTTTERESTSSVSPLHETRDRTSADLAFANRGYSTFITAAKETYENKLTNGSYDTNQATLTLNGAVSPKGTLRINGEYTNTKTDNISGYSSEYTKQHYNAVLRYNGDVISHDYQYDYTSVDTSSFDYAAQTVSANMYKSLFAGLGLKGGVSYSDSDFHGKVSGVTSIKSTSSSALAGVVYQAQYTPNFLGPFVLNTTYDFTIGSTNVTYVSTGTTSSGNYTNNDLTLSLDSQGWTNEYLGLSYSLSKRRDQSTVPNDSEQQKINARLKTTRVPKTVIEGSVDYTSTESSNNDPTQGYLSSYLAGLIQSGRTTVYSLSADHTVSYHLLLSGGASRTDSMKNSQSLSTLQTLSRTSQEYQTEYLKARFSWLFTRRLSYSAELREEWRRVLGDTTGVSSGWDQVRTTYLDMGLSYRLRQVTLSATYRLRQDDPEGAQKYTEQNYLFKASRAF